MPRDKTVPETVAALMDYFIRHDPDGRRLVEEIMGLPFEVVMEVLGDEPLFTAEWKH